MTASESITRLQANILRDAGVPLVAGMRVLDVGCGNGDIVRGWVDMGFDAYGCDFRFKPGPDVETLVQKGRLALITERPYHLPYPDAHFDALLTNQVMEHVCDYPKTLKEMRRVLKPHSFCLHIFPARFMPIEPHIHVPLASVFQFWLWLAFWARIGIRKTNQYDLSWREVADNNHRYVSSHTNYLSGANIYGNFSKYFQEFYWVEAAFLRHSPNPRGRTLYQIGRIFPVLFWVYRTFWSRVILARS